MTKKKAKWVRKPKRPNPLAVIAFWYLEFVCQHSGHLGGCLLLNSSGVGRFGTWWHRKVVGTLLWASADHRWERTA